MWGWASRAKATPAQSSQVQLSTARSSIQAPVSQMMAVPESEANLEPIVEPGEPGPHASPWQDIHDAYTRELEEARKAFATNQSQVA